MTAAVAITVATGGAAAPIIAGVMVSMVMGAGISAGMAALSGANGEEILSAASNGAIDGFMWGGIFALGGAAINAAKSAGAASLGDDVGRTATKAGCFIAGTGILTDTGIAAIEEIKVGDKVWSYNEETGENELKEVVLLYRYEKTELVHLKLSDGQKITTTTEHPFYVVTEKNWFAAKDLRAGDLLRYVNGQTVIVEWIQHELLESILTVYNFEVADNHNYFVAESVGVNRNEFVLVHNECGDLSGLSKAPKNNLPNSTYKQVDNLGNTLSITNYNADGLPIMRIDFNHSHVGIKPHVHFKEWNQRGEMIKKWIEDLFGNILE